MAGDSSIISVLEFIQNSYPTGIRQETFVPTEDGDEHIYDPYPLDEGDEAEGEKTSSDTYKYDVVRAMLWDFLIRVVKDGMQALSVQTCSEEYITLWEDFLGLPRGSDLTIQGRRGKVLAKLAGQIGTIDTILTVVKGVIGGDGSNVSIYEKFNDASPSELDLWTYELTITQPFTNVFDTSELYSIIESIQPAHANLILVIESPVADNMGMQDAAAGGINLPFRWGDDLGNPDGAIWGADVPAVDDFIWS